MLKLSFDDLLHATGLYRRDINHALKHDGFPLPTVESGHERWFADEVDEWVKCRSPQGAMPWRK